VGIAWVEASDGARPLTSGVVNDEESQTSSGVVTAVQVPTSGPAPAPALSSLESDSVGEAFFSGVSRADSLLSRGSSVASAEASSRHGASHGAQPSLASLPFVLLTTGAVHDEAEVKAAIDEAQKLLTTLLERQWTAFRSFRIWRALLEGRSPGAADMDAFLKRLPTSMPLEQVFPSLRSLRRLQHQWHGLFTHLATLPFIAYRWRDRFGREHLIILDGSGQGQLLHFSRSEENNTLSARACCSRPVASASELVTHANEAVASAIACWIFKTLAVPLHLPCA